MTSSGSWAHPRAGGENARFTSCPARLSGSSPRGRGKRLRRPARMRASGLIPARAGKTAGSPCQVTPRGAHPRAGGENYAPFFSRASWSGSSPRGRGKPIHSRSVAFAVGLIPARAGKTRAWSWCQWSPAAHPRAGGENRSTASTRRSYAWLIPARAGKTPARPHCASQTRAHPRAGGENGSPRESHHSPCRLIPARAGKTREWPRCASA